MSLFGKKTAKPKNTMPVSEAAIKPLVKAPAVHKIARAAPHIVRPLVTEKAMALSENNTYVFLVDPKVNKSEIKKEIEGLYKVDVVKVMSSKYEQKSRHYKGLASKPKGLKKVMATLKQGQKIELFNK